jgi:hypothetical protein
MVSERIMKSIPSVVMKLGISNRSVMNALRKPIRAQIKMPTANAGQNGTPAFSISAMLIGMIAKTELTDRSNSPQIISIAKPIVTAPTSGTSPSTPRMF